MANVNQLIEDKKVRLWQSVHEFLTAGRIYQRHMNGMISEVFDLCSFYDSEFRPVDIAGLNTGVNTRAIMKPYDRWMILDSNHDIDFRPDWSMTHEMYSDEFVEFDEFDCYEIKTITKFAPNDSNLQLSIDDK